MTTKKGSTHDPQLFTRNPLTRETAARLADAIAHRLTYDAEDVADLLLLMHALAYEADATNRENMLIDAELKLVAYLPGVDAATEAAKRARLDLLTKGGAR